MEHFKLLETIREKIDIVDYTIIKLLVKRRGLVQKAGKYKYKRKIPYWQNDRVKEIMKTRTKLGKKLGLKEELVLNIFKTIINFAMKEEKNINKK